MNIGFVNEETWAFVNEIYAELDRRQSLTRFASQPHHIPLLAGRLNRGKFERDLRRFLAQNQVVFFEWASEILAAATRQPKTCAIVTRLHRYEMYHWAGKINWDAVDAVILVSQAKKREFSALFPQQAHKVVVIPEAVDPQRFTFQWKPFEKRLGILGNLTPRKRVYELILALAGEGLAADGYQLHIGGGAHPRFLDYDLAIRGLIEKLGLHGQVHLYGAVHDAPEFFRNIDVFISNSYSEGLQVSPMEAMASGCYALAHDWDGADELLPADQRFLTDGQLAERLRTYAGLSAAQQQAACLNLRRRVENDFSALNIAAQVSDVVEQAGRNWTER